MNSYNNEIIEIDRFELELFIQECLLWRLRGVNIWILEMKATSRPRFNHIELAMKKITFAIPLVALVLHSSALTTEEHPSARFVWDGELTLEKLNAFNERLKNSPPVTGIEFIRSPGASSNGGIIINELNKQIESRKLKTFARGQCSSACAVAFLLGEERTLLPSSNNVPTHLMIHAMRNNKTGEINYGGTDQMLKKIVTKSSGKITMEFLEKIYDAKNQNGGLFILRDSTLMPDGNKQSVFFAMAKKKFTNAHANQSKACDHKIWEYLSKKNRRYVSGQTYLLPVPGFLCFHQVMKKGRHTQGLLTFTKIHFQYLQLPLYIT